MVKSWDQLVYMQDMNAAACASQTTPAANATSVPTKTLTDSRDGNTYTIAKLKDGNCWMTQNLRLVGDKILTSEDSDIEDILFLPGSVSLSGSDNPKQFSVADQGQLKVYYANNVTNGAYYNWYTATARTGNDSINTDGANAPSSICPKGWKLPTGGSDTGQLYSLLNGLAVAQVTTSPYHFVYGGYVNGSNPLLAGSQGWYWSSTASNASYAYILNFSTSVSPSNTLSRYSGASVRCVAK